MRLDRAVACPQWSAMFPQCKVQHVISSRSDHCPLFIQLLGSQPNVTFNKHLRYEAFCERESLALDEQVRKCWSKSTQVRDLKDVATNLNKLMKDLHSWSQEHIGYLPKKMEAARKRFNLLFKRSDRAAVLERRKILLEMDGLLLKEEVMWKQRSCIEKMILGDRNMKFFQRKASWRAKKNNISAIKRRAGSITENVDEIIGVTNSFFQHLYSCDANVDPSRIIPLVKPLVNDDMNEELCKPFSEEEISDALFQIGHLKAPGPDGFPARFF